MPPVYIVLHVLASVICFFAVLRAPARPKWTAGIALCTFLFVAVGFTIERRSDWARSVLAWSISDLVYLTNFALEGSAVLLALLWKAASDKKGRVRAEADGKWVHVADPTNGRERWPSDDLRYLWDGTALGLAAK